MVLVLVLFRLLDEETVLDRKYAPSWTIACPRQSPATPISSHTTIQIFLILVASKAALLHQHLRWLPRKPLQQNATANAQDQWVLRG